MKYLVSVAMLALSGCFSFDYEEEAVPPSAEALHEVWEKQVDDSIASFTAIRPTITGSDYSLKLFDVTLDGLIAISGSPSQQAVADKMKLIELADPKVLVDLGKRNKEIDIKTTQLEDKARLAEERALLAEKKLADSDRRSRLNELSGWISTAGAVGAMIGFLAFVFVPAAITPKWVSAVAIPMSVGLSIFGHRLLEWLGTESAGLIMGISGGFILVNALGYFAWKLWWSARNRLRETKEPTN